MSMRGPLTPFLVLAEAAGHSAAGPGTPRHGRRFRQARLASAACALLMRSCQ